MADESTEFFSPQGHPRHIAQLPDPQKEAKSNVHLQELTEIDRATDTVEKCLLKCKVHILELKSSDRS